MADFEDKVNAGFVHGPLFYAVVLVNLTKREGLLYVLH